MVLPAPPRRDRRGREPDRGRVADRRRVGHPAEPAGHPVLRAGQHLVPDPFVHGHPAPQGARFVEHARAQHHIRLARQYRGDHVRQRFGSVLPIAVEQDPQRLRPSDIPFAVGDSRRLQSSTGWRPAHALGETLGDLLSYWREKAAVR